ncbi:hypothetical protein Btru_071982 [Bulinus truncatus]|nr:hypothetical protein Btru_071982 [Bulinus truncatus]
MHYAFAIFVTLLVLTAAGNFQIFISKQFFSYWDTESSVLGTFIWDLLLLFLFIAQHSIMATDWFRRKLSTWFQITVSQRLIYVTATSLSLMYLIAQWHSIPDCYLWFVDTQGHFFLWLFFFLIHALAWLMIGLELVLVDVGELIGISQILCYHRLLRLPLADKESLVREIYSRMRHPGAILLTFMLWFHPIMSLDRLLLACMLTSYIIGRHSFDDYHVEFAKSYYSVKTTQIKSKSITSYDYIEKE